MTNTTPPADPPLTPRQKLSWQFFSASSAITVFLAAEQGWRQGLAAIAATFLAASIALGLSNLRTPTSGRGS